MLSLRRGNAWLTTLLIGHTVVDPHHAFGATAASCALLQPVLTRPSAWRIRRWAVGILLFEMLAGFPPFYDDSPFLIYQRVLSGRIDFPFHVDRDAKVSRPGCWCCACNSGWCHGLPGRGAQPSTDGCCRCRI